MLVIVLILIQQAPKQNYMKQVEFFFQIVLSVSGKKSRNVNDKTIAPVGLGVFSNNN